MRPALSPLTLLLLTMLGLPGAAAGQDRWATHYEERLERFRLENEALPARWRTLVFVGDSITEGFPLRRYFPEHATLNRGIGADRIGLGLERGVLHRLRESVFDAQAQIVFLQIGVNDLASSPEGPDHWAGGIDEILTRIRKGAPQVQVVLQTLLPVGRKYGRHAELAPRIRRLNEALRELAGRQRRTTLLDLHPLYADQDGFLPDGLGGDGLHLHADAYERWAAAIRDLPLRFPAEMPAPRLRKGDRGDAVRSLQRALAGAGYPVGEIDGAFGGRTESAVRAFQRDHGLPTDGLVREDTLAALREAVRRGPPEAAGETGALGGATELELSLSGGGPIRAASRDGKVVAFRFEAKMSICADGATNVTRDEAAARADPNLRHDPWYQPQTAMNFEGQPVDADSVPYIVLPPPVYQATGAQKGDLCEVVYQGRRHYAIYAEVGPRDKIGEGSMFLARQLGIDDDPRRGGLEAQEVSYTVLVGSGRPRGIYNGGPAVTDERIQRLGREAFEEARRTGVLD